MSVKLGRLVAGSAPDALLVDFDGNTAGALPARSVPQLDEAAIQGAVLANREVVLLFENNDPRVPIIMGLVSDGPGAELFGALLAPSHSASPRPQIEARVDGRRVVLEGQDEVVLRCGDASVSLQSDGKVIVRGAYVETHASGLNRIKGASVKIN